MPVGLQLRNLGRRAGKYTEQTKVQRRTSEKKSDASTASSRHSFSTVVPLFAVSRGARASSSVNQHAKSAMILQLNTWTPLSSVCCCIATPYLYLYDMAAIGNFLSLMRTRVCAVFQVLNTLFRHFCSLLALTPSTRGCMSVSSVLL